jgi:hypothetical protein
VRGHGGQPDHDHRDPEQPPVVQRADDRAGQHDAQPAADGDDRRDGGHGGGDPGGRELVADDAERQREDGATDALHDPADDEDADVGGDGGHQAAEGERGERGDQHPFLADHVADPSEDRREDRRAEQVGGQHPGHGVLGGVQVLLDGR